ncbi:MAG: hypothetical protein LBC45_01675 [Chlamydiales bacterium]|jgi:hypothetical protein|nr:hypothetical protein [Chlamydiales bacterium]
MKAFLLLVLFAANGFCTHMDKSMETYKENPGLYLNFQDVPIFHKDNPLEGLDGFAVISFQRPEIDKEIQSVIKQELGSLGTVIQAKSGDMRGFATGNILNIQIGRVSKWDGEEFPISRITLHIETFVIIRKTHIRSMLRIWSINDFIETPLHSQSQDEIGKAVQRLLREFIKNYKFANPHQTQKPIFYIY